MANERCHVVSELHKCACRDCLVDCLAELCSRCNASQCDGNGRLDCRAPDAYALSAKRSAQPKGIT